PSGMPGVGDRQDVNPDDRRRTMAKTARDIMSSDCTCIGESESVLDAAKKLAELNVGAMPICGEDDRLKGMITDRDIAIKVIAQGMDPNTCTAGELQRGEAVTIGADDGIEELMKTMMQHQVRRLPVIDGHKLVGIVAQADVARAMPDQPVGDLLDALSMP
ncbi:MAG TPA: CBS domain-containing protein, partial [Sporichthya sp.]|nr:CBS domain-containing protein [Sporichthya sp.]